jgi:hypothetical protein
MPACLPETIPIYTYIFLFYLMYTRISLKEETFTYNVHTRVRSGQLKQNRIAAPLTYILCCAIAGLQKGQHSSFFNTVELEFQPNASGSSGNKNTRQHNKITADGAVLSYAKLEEETIIIIFPFFLGPLTCIYKCVTDNFPPLRCLAG